MRVNKGVVGGERGLIPNVGKNINGSTKCPNGREKSLCEGDTIQGMLNGNPSYIITSCRPLVSQHVNLKWPQQRQIRGQVQ